jgi:adenylate kinase family enzyme
VQSRAPGLVIVSGAPGGGKTTLARRLSLDVGLPLLSCDFAGLPEAAMYR